MGKAEVGTPKWLANKMKSKGLQKLRWYCQMCQKQCRDQNGFKCHIQSESHQRQLLIFAENPNRFLHDFSKEFEDGYLDLLKRMHGTKRVEANKVYQEYIAHKEHIHMNATRWETLTGFVMYLGRTGKCVVDQTEKGWYVAWIDRDPETIARQEALAKKEKLDKDDNERMAEFIQKQVAKAKDKGGDDDKDNVDGKFTELIRDNEEEKLQLQLKVNEATKKPVSTLKQSSSSIFKVPSSGSNQTSKALDDGKTKRKTSALEEIMAEEEERKKRARSKAEDSKQAHIKDYWLKKGIVVKIITKSLGDKYYKEKGVVKEVVDRYGAVISLLNTNTKIKLDQDHLETVIPAEGKPVLVLNGPHRGEEGILCGIDVKQFSAVVNLKRGGSVSLPYEHFSKLHVK